MCTWDIENQRWIECLRVGRADHQIAYKRKAAPAVTSTPLEDWARWVNQVGRASVASKFVEFEAKVAELKARVAELEERNANQAAEIAKLRKQVETRDAQIEELTVAHDDMIAIYHEVTAKPTNAVRPHPLEQWWMDKAQAEVEPLIAKMTEYGGEGRAVDLTQIGEALRIAGVNVGGYTQELGVYFYLVGKFGRWTAAIREGRPVSDDTLHDIGIYVRMAQRIRESGGWPS